VPAQQPPLQGEPFHDPPGEGVAVSLLQAPLDLRERLGKVFDKFLDPAYEKG